jgi:tellurite methyltransferase
MSRFRARRFKFLARLGMSGGLFVAQPSMPSREVNVARVPLVECRFLDPRPTAQAATRPIVGAANIPQAELPQRTSELPPRDEMILVVGPDPPAAQTVAWLAAHGRRAMVAADVRYATTTAGDAIGRLWRPNSFLAEVLPQLTPGRALDLACGTGRDAVFAASRGWQVTAVDVLPDALERARRLAAACAAAIEPVEWIQADLERDPPSFGPDFDLVVSVRYLHRPLLRRVVEWLRPGGSLVCETFTTLHRQRHGRPVHDEHVLRPGELPRLLAGLEIRSFSEAWRGTAHTARVWALAPVQ